MDIPQIDIPQIPMLTNVVTNTIAKFKSTCTTDVLTKLTQSTIDGIKNGTISGNALIAPGITAKELREGLPDFDKSPAMIANITNAVQGRVMQCFMDRVDSAMQLASTHAGANLAGGKAAASDLYSNAMDMMKKGMSASLDPSAILGQVKASLPALPDLTLPSMANYVDPCHAFMDKLIAKKLSVAMPETIDLKSIHVLPIANLSIV